MFGLSPIVEALGGKLTSDESGESITLQHRRQGRGDRPRQRHRHRGRQHRLALAAAVAGRGGAPGAARLPRARPSATCWATPSTGAPRSQRLTIARRGNRELPVSLDVVHLQGMTTVVLAVPRGAALPAQPLAAGGDHQVQMLSDRLTPPPAEGGPGSAGAGRSPSIRSRSASSSPRGRRPRATCWRTRSGWCSTSIRRRRSRCPRSRWTQRRSGSRASTRSSSIPATAASRVGGDRPGRRPGEGADPAARPRARRQARAAPRRAGRAHPHRGRPGAASTRARRIANQNKADLFISIHLNSSLGAGAHGTETYFLSPQATDTARRPAAAAENATPPAAPRSTAHGAGSRRRGRAAGSSTSSSGTSRRPTTCPRASGFANLIQGELNETLQLKDRGVKQAPFRVLMGATMPAVLVELGFISNPEEEKKLQDPAYRDQLVDALVAGRRPLQGRRSRRPAAPAPAPGRRRPPGGPGSRRRDARSGHRRRRRRPRPSGHDQPPAARDRAGPHEPPRGELRPRAGAGAGPGRRSLVVALRPAGPRRFGAGRAGGGCPEGRAGELQPLLPGRRRRAAAGEPRAPGLRVAARTASARSSRRSSPVPRRRGWPAPSRRA